MHLPSHMIHCAQVLQGVSRGGRALVGLACLLQGLHFSHDWFRQNSRGLSSSFAYLIQDIRELHRQRRVRGGLWGTDKCSTVVAAPDGVNCPWQVPVIDDLQLAILLRSCQALPEAWRCRCGSVCAVLAALFSKWLRGHCCSICSAQATQRRLRLLRGTASAGKGVASAEARKADCSSTAVHLKM